jgi:hypothetical protein
MYPKKGHWWPDQSNSQPMPSLTNVSSRLSPVSYVMQTWEQCNPEETPGHLISATPKTQGAVEEINNKMKNVVHVWKPIETLVDNSSDITYPMSLLDFTLTEKRENKNGSTNEPDSMYSETHNLGYTDSEEREVVLSTIQPPNPRQGNSL